jgi:hypothetical protein
MSDLAAVCGANGNCYMNHEVIQKLQSYSDAMYERAVRTFAYHNYLYDNQRLEDDDEESQKIQRIANCQFNLCRQLMDDSNKYYRRNFLPWKQRLVAERSNLQDRCERYYSVFDFTYPEYGFRRQTTDDVWWHMRVYHNCCEAYHLCQCVEARFMYNSHHLADSTDHLARTVATVYNLSAEEWQNNYEQTMNEFDW